MKSQLEKQGKNRSSDTFNAIAIAIAIAIAVQWRVLLCAERDPVVDQRVLFDGRVSASNERRQRKRGVREHHGSDHRA